ncbi:restriction endonuclease subunit S [Pseudoalteromonas phenolica]|uniref:restriction endonuclease subunit S n=1 Tax=Pseudoalteromonas phenolica TaxID=161398 RepID=UPI00110BDDA6|nr:restriction endonuclease subunit S [Pseudoalteromonas phenolica]TMO53745.1 phosphoglycerate mutase [Pseudoalteromonas phenolica]
MSKYPAYSEYKPTHLGWLQQVPAHWEVKRLKYLGEAIIGLTYSPDDVVDCEDGTLVLRSSNIQNKKLAFEDNVYVNKLVPEKLKTQLGDILICARNGSRALIGKNAQIDEVAVGMTFGAFMSVFRSPYNNYLSKVFNSALFEYQSGSFLTATINQLTTANLNSFEIPLPPESERITISNFLDHETAKIDTLIEKQQQLIKLLKEKRQAVISHAVTKGLNPKVPMKDSGVEWLGEVPEHWGVCKLKWKARTTSGGTPTTSKYELYYENGHIPWIRTTDLNNDLLYETPVKITPKAVNDTACSILPENSVLLAMYGGAGSIGKHSLLKFESTINQAVCGIFPSNTLIPEYLHRFYEYYRPFWMIGAAGTRKDPNIGQDDIKEAKVLIPPETEQKAISNHIDKMQNHFDLLTQQAENAIALMQERRTALISAVVTGKIDVRNWKKPKVNEEEVA